MVDKKIYNGRIIIHLQLMYNKFYLLMYGTCQNLAPWFACTSIYISSPVDLTAAESNLPLHPVWRWYFTHLHNCLGEILGERLAVRAVHFHQMVQGSTVAVERLVGCEEAAPPYQVPVVCVVKPHWGLLVEWSRRVVSGLACLPAQLRKRGIDVGAALSVVAVDSVPVVVAPRRADGVGAGERRHVACIEVVLLEQVNELGERGVGSWETVFGTGPVGDARVLAAELHFPGWAPEQGDSVAGGEREDVGAGDRGRAGMLDVRLDLVDDVEAVERVGVGRGVLLALEKGRLVQEDGAVASLHAVSISMSSLVQKLDPRHKDR